MKLFGIVAGLVKIGSWKASSILILKLSLFAAGLIAMAITSGVPVQDPWFDGFAGYYVFSALVAGMPEPDANSSFVYIWMYRSGHILSANGTAYFSHKSMWNEISGKKE